MEDSLAIRTSYCSEMEGFPHLLRSCALRMGIRKKPEYVWKEYLENGMENALWQSTREKADTIRTTLLSKSLLPDTASQILARMLLEQPSDNYARTTTR
jgi:hypothetical protein